MKAVGLLFIVGRGLEMVELEGNNKVNGLLMVMLAS